MNVVRYDNIFHNTEDDALKLTELTAAETSSCI